MRLFPQAFARLATANLPPAPLPSLTDGLSRRAALFSAVTVSGALVGSATRALSGPAPSSPSPADARLCALAELMGRAERIGKNAEAAFGPDFHDAPEWHGAVDGFYGAAVVMRDTPAASHEGITAKARAMALPWLVSDPETAADIGASLAADVLRLTGEVA